MKQFLSLFLWNLILAGNQIKLIGRVKNEVLRLQNGFDSFHIRTATRGLGNLIG